MSTRTPLAIVATILVLAAMLLAGTASIALGNPLAQGNPTEQQQTIDAVIAERFTQTASVEQSAGLTLTAEVGTFIAPTLTAAFEATIDAAFNQALTATAAPQATATAQAFAGVRDQIIAWQGMLANDATARLGAVLDALRGIPVGLVSAGGNTFLALAQTSLEGAEFAERQAAAVALLQQAVRSDPRLNALLIYDGAGQVLAATDGAPVAESVAGEPYFAESLAGPAMHAPFWPLGATAPVLILTAPIADAGGILAGVLAVQVTLEGVDAALSEAAQAAGAQPVAIYLVSAAESRLLAPATFNGLQGYPMLSSEGIAFGVSGQSGSGLYSNYQTPPVPVIGVIRPVSQLGAVLLVEVAQADALAVAAAIPSPTPAPTRTPSPVPGTATPRPSVFPTDTIAEVAIAEQLFEHGRMFWIRHTRQIWVMVDGDDPSFPGGDWYCFNDTFVEGDPEIDPNLIPPEGLFQPRRGFGKLWRTHPELKDPIGWARTPEFELTSRYTYIAGGYVDGGKYVPGPGEHRLTTLYNESISFFEREIRGDCLGGTWRQTPAQ